ncbi:MAG TPA: recombinase family protein [Candidatus Saccharimonadales bacterium]|nr:recombinase family protein [Candidatus Saccharimonadales bacterium]
MNPNYQRPRNGLLAVRVSTIGQGIDGDSPEAQIEQGERYAPARNIKIVKILTYLESASREAHQPMQDVVNYAIDPKNKIDVIIVKSIDRFTRAGSTSYDLLKSQLEPHGVELEDIYGVISNVKVNTLEHLGVKYRWSEYSPSRKTELLEAERAKDEVRDILSRMIGAQVRYTRMGYWMRSSPYGLKSERVETGNGKRYILVPNEEEAPFIRKMFELRCQGHLSDTKIVEEINRLGYASRYQNRRAKTDKTQITGRTGGHKLTLKRFWLYIANPIYAGVIREKWTEDQPVKARFDGLIDFETFNKANRGKMILSMQDGVVSISKQRPPEHQLRKGSHNAEYPYRKVVTCSECRKPFFGSAAKGRYKYYPGYHCDKRGHHYRVPKDKLEATVEEFVRKVTFTQEYIDALMTALETVWQQRREELGQDEALIDKRIDELKAQAFATVDKIKLLSSPTAIKFMEDELMQVEQELNKLNEEKEQKEKEKPVSFEVVMAYAKYFLQHMDYLLLQQIDPLKKADFFSVIFNETPTYAEIASVTTDSGTNAWDLTGINELFKIKKDTPNPDVSFMVRVTGL